MRNQTATRHGDRRELEAVATDHIAVAQVRAWVTAHKLNACRVCTGFRLDELGPTELVASADSDRSDASGPALASAQAGANEHAARIRTEIPDAQGPAAEAQAGQTHAADRETSRPPQGRLSS